jgi:hypothetical protein
MPIDGRRQILKRMLVFAMVLMMLALAVSSASADDGTIKGDIKINPGNVVIEPPPFPNIMLPMESISLNNVIIDPPPFPHVAEDGKATPILF